MTRKPKYELDERIGYGLSIEGAIEMVRDRLEGEVVHFVFTTKDHDIAFAEKRDDGWRVYIPRPLATTARKQG